MVFQPPSGCTFTCEWCNFRFQQALAHIIAKLVVRAGVISLSVLLVFLRYAGSYHHFGCVLAIIHHNGFNEISNLVFPFAHASHRARGRRRLQAIFTFLHFHIDGTESGVYLSIRERKNQRLSRRHNSQGCKMCRDTITAETVTPRVV